MRRAAVDLLGKYVGMQPEFAERYYSAIVERITDIGVSVRKCVISILRECLASDSFTKKHEAMVRIMFRIRDDEPSIQAEVISTFHDLWFKSPISIERRTQQLVLVVWQVCAKPLDLLRASRRSLTT